MLARAPEFPWKDKWVQEKSRAVADIFLMPVDVRNAALREHGDQMLQDRFRPLVARP